MLYDNEPWLFNEDRDGVVHSRAPEPRDRRQEATELQSEEDSSGEDDAPRASDAPGSGSTIGPRALCVGAPLRSAHYLIRGELVNCSTSAPLYAIYAPPSAAYAKLAAPPRYNLPRRCRA